MSVGILAPFYVAALPPAIRSRIVPDVNGLDMHVLEAGHEPAGRPVLLLLHGFPEFAFCWRRLMPLLAAEGYHVIAPDQRGYSSRKGAQVSFEDDPADCDPLDLVADMVALVGRIGIQRVDAVIGHDFGAMVAGLSVLARPDLFGRLILIGTPFAGAPPLGMPSGPSLAQDAIHGELARLDPPRKHYQIYFAGAGANDDLVHCPQGIATFLRGYYHHKSADWPGNAPHPLADWSAEQVARMPDYYCMPAADTMADVAAAHMPDPRSGDCDWLTDDELDLIAAEFGRAGFQGPLQWYRSAVNGGFQRGLRLFAGRKVTVPTVLIAGRADWGTFQTPGALDAVRDTLATEPTPIHFVEGAGHWIQQEQPERLAGYIMAFLAATRR